LTGECTTCSFPFICIDSVPMLFYSPRGLESLPEGFWTGGNNGNKYFKPQQIDNHWFFCRWDQ
jgi:hypothetical protein